jgi:peptidoglycan/LPS O-acetylase OafA/YrhL
MSDNAQRTGSYSAAIITIASVVLAFAAFDDITTDADTNFTAERLTLAAAAVWCAFLVRDLMHQGQRTLGVLSLIMLGAGLVAYFAIGPGTTHSWQLAYVAMAGSLAWFLGIAGLLIYQRWRLENRR